MIAVGEDLVLQGQERAAGIHQIQAGQPVLQRDLLRSQMLLDGDREIRAALHGRIIGNDHAFPTGHAADAGDDAGGWHIPAIQAMGRELRELQERRAGIYQPSDTLARQQLAARDVTVPRNGATAQFGLGHFGAQIVHRGAQGGGVDGEILAPGVECGTNAHAVSANSSRPISIRLISLVPAPISYSLASRSRRPVG